MNRQIGLAVLVIVGVSGCATMSQEECLVSDWQSVGYEDGTRGASVGTISKYRKTCAKHGVSPDLQAYRQGYEEGVVVYCQPARGFNEGSRGRSYSGVCPADLEPEFLDGYQAGRQLYDLRAGVNRTSNLINQKERRLKVVKEELVRTAADLVSDGPTPEERVLLLQESQDLAKEQGSLEEEIIALEREHAVLTRELALYEESLSAYDF